MHHQGNGYQIGLRPDQVDALRLRGQVREAEAARSAGDLDVARHQARQAPTSPSPRLRSTDPSPPWSPSAREDQARARRLLGSVLLARGDAGEALPLLEDALARDPGRRGPSRRGAPRRVVGARCPGRAGALRGVRRADARQRRGRAGGGAAPAAPRPPRARRTRARGSEVRRGADGRPRRRRRLDPRPSRAFPGRLGDRRRRTRQDPDGPPGRTPGAAAGRLLRGAGRRHHAGGRAARGGLGPGGARVGDQRAHRPAACRPALPGGRAALRATDAADPGQLRAPRRSRGRPGRVPGGEHRLDQRADHLARPARDRGRAGLPAAAARGRGRGAALRPAGPIGPLRRTPGPGGGDGAGRRGSTVCPWRSSWPRPRCG